MKKINKITCIALIFILVITMLSVFIGCTRTPHEEPTPEPAETIKVKVNRSQFGTIMLDKSTYNKGDDVVVTIKPSSGYLVQKVTVNTKDVTDQLVDNVLTIENAQQDLTIRVTLVEMEYGTLAIDDIVVAKGETVQINPVFSVAEAQSSIVYNTFGSADVSISGNAVTGLTAGKVINVVASTAHHEAVFKITTVETYGLHVADVYTWEGYQPSQFNLCFDGIDEQKVTYTYDTSALTLDETNHTVIGKKTGTFTVNVQAGSYSTSFKVTHSNVSKTGDKWNTSAFDSYFNELKQKCSVDLLNTTTLFIGDSFFDARYFWTNFYDHYYAGNDAVLAGIGSTTTYDWEQFLPKLVQKVQPQNLVINVGTNNLFDDSEDAQTASESLQRLLHVIHTACPNTNVYYFSIIKRSNDTNKHKQIAQVNDVIKNQFSRGKDWFTFIDVYDEIGFDKIKDDTIHPKLETYSIYVERLEQLGCVIASR